ncbi:tRNA epoxyqueuosine(34) reductase QueG [Alteromonas facilis]|uniref:tRNA epoxyqueuosine(34) reductase QueG n=1 Tax=Alteromonas facilis TaxID=2048004 RepID=UPI000C28CD14|nr:tRNA epoxyqueuosine(34) reductase QueG [Alteromonas facilis]
MTTIDSIDLNQLADNIKAWGKALGFQHVGISDLDLSQHEKYLQQWLDAGYHGNMEYMQRHGLLRARPEELVPGSLRAISVRLDYLPADAAFAQHLKDNNIAYISRYALGRDYHKVVRNKLKKLGEKIASTFADTAFRPFVDSAPILEHAIAEKAGIGWTGKHSLTLNEQAGSWFFLGELLVNLPLPVDAPVEEKCGSCTACLTMCPTQAIVAPYQVDARRCISYLTIEYDGIIDEALRPLMGNRIYGCDDCQMVCPYNREAPLSEESDFTPRDHLFGRSLLELISWSEADFLTHTEGSPIRRIGFQKWLRNIAVAIGNAPFAEENIEALTLARTSAEDIALVHIDWAIEQQKQKSKGADTGANRQVQRLIRSVEKGLPRDA